MRCGHGESVLRYVKTVTFPSRTGLWSNPRQEQTGAGTMRYLRWLTKNLLVAYMAAVAAQQVWALLNSDVREIARRLH